MLKWSCCVLAIALGGCLLSDESDGPTLGPGEGYIGPNGGTVTLPDGPTLEIPAGALHQSVTIRITQSATEVPTAVSGVYAFEPAGLIFDTPVTVKMPADTSSQNLYVFWSRDDGQPGYVMLGSSTDSLGLRAQITHFSEGFVAPAVVAGDHYKYVIDHIMLPTTNTQARAYGLDISGDGVVDNQFGMVISTLAGMGIQLSDTVTMGVDQGGSITLIDLQTTSLVDASDAGLQTYVGATPMPAPCGVSDTVCRHHLDGTGSFTVAADSPVYGAATARFYGGTMIAGPGRMVLQMELNRGRPLTLDFVGAAAKASGVSATAIPSGVIDGGMTESEVDMKLVPELAIMFDAEVKADCTYASSSCTCTTDSQGKTADNLFDTNHDCAISDTEVRNNSLILSLLAPDVTIGGVPCLSFGVGVTAVHATFTP